jgi:hypothetical protein
MTKRLLFAALLSLGLLAAACGGGDDDDGGNGGGGTAGTAQMATRFSDELGKIKECVQGQVNGGAACGIDFLNDPVTRMCSDVRTGKVNAEFPKADLTKFTATCDDWKNFLTLDANAKLTTLDKMIADAGAIK